MISGDLNVIPGGHAQRDLPWTPLSQKRHSHYIEKSLVFAHARYQCYPIWTHGLFCFSNIGQTFFQTKGMSGQVLK